MNRIKYLLSSVALLALPLVTFAQTFDPGDTELGGFLNNILIFINSVIIPFIFGIGFLVFVWGMFQFFIAGGANEEKKEQGKSLMIYSILGFVLIIVFWGLVNLIAGTFDLNEPIDPDLIPKTIPIDGKTS